MFSVLGDIVPYALPVALSPIPLIATIALLLAPSGLGGGIAFLVSRFAVLAVAAFVVALLVNVLPDSAGRERAGWIRIVVGCLVIAGGIVTFWRSGPRPGEEAKVPGWMASIDRATVAGAARLGAILTVANVKELSFALGAGLILGGAALPAVPTLAAALVFAVLSSIGTAVPVVWLALAGPSARNSLQVAADWLRRNNSIVIAVVLVAIGVMLIGSGLEAL